MRGILLILIWTLLAVPAALVIIPITLITRDTRLLLRTGFWITRTPMPWVGVRVVVHGIEHLPQGASIVMANHASNLDPPSLLARIPRQVVIYLKASLMKIPILGYAMTLAGFIPVSRDGTVESAKQSSEAALRALRGNRCVVVFPEGTRSRDGALLPFKKGPFFLAMESNAPVVPVAIRGARELLPKGSLNLKAGTVTVTYQQPLTPSSFATREDLMEAVRASIQAGLTASR